MICCWLPLAVWQTAGMDGWTIISLADEAADDNELDDLLEPPVSELRCPEPRPSPDELDANEVELAGDAEEEPDDDELLDFGEAADDEQELAAPTDEPQLRFFDDNDDDDDDDGDEDDDEEDDDEGLPVDELELDPVELALDECEWGRQEWQADDGDGET